MMRFGAGSRERSSSGVAAGVRVRNLALAVLGLLGVGACSVSVANSPINVPLADTNQLPSQIEQIPQAGDVGIGLAFSGGGIRASAFAYGILNELERTLVQRRGESFSLAEEIRFVTGSSGGSVTAAYFALKGTPGYRDLYDKYLIQDVEAGLRTSLTLANVARAVRGGVNDSTDLPRWLDANLFNGATYDDVFRRGRTALYVNASDIVTRVPFIFDTETFQALCSDLRQYPLSNAVAASAAVPFIFAPVVIESYKERCDYRRPQWIDKALAGPKVESNISSYARAIDAYSADDGLRYVKLLDGGVTDNFGLHGLLIARSAARTPYEPMTKELAVRLRRVLFLVINSGRPPVGDYGNQVRGPTGLDLLIAAAETAIDGGVRNSYDSLVAKMADWQRAVVDWRCQLSAAQVRRLRGSTANWNCRDFSIVVDQVGFEQAANPADVGRLAEIPTRFQLPREEVDFLIAQAGEILRSNGGYRQFLASVGSARTVTPHRPAR